MKLEVGSRKSEVRSQKKLKKTISREKKYFCTVVDLFFAKNELLVKSGLPYFLMSLSFFRSLFFILE